MWKKTKTYEYFAVHLKKLQKVKLIKCFIHLLFVVFAPTYCFGVGWSMEKKLKQSSSWIEQ